MSEESTEPRQPIWEHLEELRSRLIRVLVVSCLAGAVAYNFSDALVYWLEKPLLQALPAGQGNLYFTGVADKFFAYLKISFVVGLAAVSPYLLWEVWGFISPALEPKERRFAVPFTLFGTLSFVTGVAFGYYVVLPNGYAFLVNFGSPVEKPLITIAEYFSLTLKLLLAMGLIFEVPVVMGLLAKLGLLKAATLRRIRKQAIIVNTIVAAVITPTPDAFTMLLVMVPLTLLFELGVITVAWIEKRQDDSDPIEPTTEMVGFPREPESV